MRRMGFYVAVLAVVSFGASLCTGQEKKSSKDGFVILFDGKNLDHWTMGPEKSWVVVDGEIHLKREFDGKEHNLDYLWTKEQYGDFVLELEFKVPERANSGVFYRTEIHVRRIQVCVIRV